MAKFKVYRLSDINQIEDKLNTFELGEILDYSVTAPDYRIIVLVVRYDEGADDKAAK